MITATSKRITEYISTHKQARPHELIDWLGISNTAVHKQLRKLVVAGKLKRIGRPPLVFYQINEEEALPSAEISKKEQKVIENNYFYISPTGEIISGLEGFLSWARQIKQEQNLSSLAREYVSIRQKANKFISKEGLIDATAKVRTTFRECFVDKVFYRDFYSLPKFGKTKLGQLMLHAKQSQNKQIIVQLAQENREIINKIIKLFRISAVAFIPHTVPRKIQFLKEFEKRLVLNLPVITLLKVYAGEVIVPQKTLSHLEERIANAKQTIFIKKDHGRYQNALVVDDALGSGATVNETAKKLKQSGLVKNKVVAFTIVGSFKGFDVIREA